MKTMICLILDRSGSMQGRQGDVIGGVNSFIADQKTLPHPACIAFVRFDGNATERFRPMMNLVEVKPLEPGEYVPRGSTPLLDAVGSTIAQLDDDWKRERPDRAIVVIVTDGQENASHEYSKEKVRQMITARQDSGLWSFIYLGADVDAFHEAGQYGIAHHNTANFVKTSAGIGATYGMMTNSVKSMRATGSTSANLGGDIEEDGTLTKKAPKPMAASFDPRQDLAWKAPEATTTWTPPSVS